MKQPNVVEWADGDERDAFLAPARIVCPIHREQGHAQIAEKDPFAGLVRALRKRR